MGLVEKIGRKLAGRPTEMVSSKPDVNGTVNETVVRHIPQGLEHQGKCQTRHGYVHAEAAKGQTGLLQTAIVGPKIDPFIATRDTRFNENQAPVHQHGTAKHHVPPAHPRTNQVVPPQQPRTNHTIPPQQPRINQTVPPQQPRTNPIVPSQQPRTNHIVPPTSRLVSNPPETRRAESNTARSAANDSQRFEVTPQANGNSRSHANALHKQPSIASSLHSSRSGKTFNGGSSQQGSFGEQRARANTMPSNSQRPFGMSTRRMEDSAYHAGFRDAVAQLERERQGRGAAISH